VWPRDRSGAGCVQDMAVIDASETGRDTFRTILAKAPNAHRIHFSRLPQDK
jgi:hypothetical protein